jgi:N-methylhydantoinase B
MPNVEDNEWFYPILYLWRKELVNSGGAGKYRGGNSAEIAFIPYGTDLISLFTASGHCAVPGPGLHGGLSPATTRFTIQRNAHVTAQLQETKRMPTSIAELRGKREYIAPKAFDVSQKLSDVFLLSWAGAGGYGDPLERDPARVVLDIRRGNVTREWAREAYGVVLDHNLHVDTEATGRLRAKLRKVRIARASKRERRKIDPTRALHIAEGLLLSQGVIACSKCAHEICAATENYKLHCAMTEQPITAVNPYILDPKTYVDDDMVFRSYACPSCGLLIQTEMARPTDPPLWDIQLAEK